MSYKVFFVEDEIVTREGIRDNVDWNGNGFEFCGEAPDGEIALPFLQATHPDVLITDIKMPFMDGLQLSRIVRARMPWIKIVILSGHDEFEYAQEAIKIGVTEYLLKPVTVQDLHNVLQRLAAQLEQEREEKENIRKLQEQVKENRAILGERFLLKLVMGAVSPVEAIDKGEEFGLDLVARYYLVAAINIRLRDASQQFDYQEYLQAQQIISGLVENNPDVFLVRKDLTELVLLMKGNTSEYLREEGDFLLNEIKRRVSETRCEVTIGVGAHKERLTDVYQSFIEALVNVRNEPEANEGAPISGDERAELLKLDKSAVENYLKCGVKEGYDGFFDSFIQPLAVVAFRWQMIKSYLFTDVILATAKFIGELGGNIEQVIPELDHIQPMLASIRTIEEMRQQVREILTGALAYRDSKSNNLYVGMIQQAKHYIETHYSDPDLALDNVAAHVSLSPCHFSAVFSQEAGATFKEYLTELRINKAKELLRTTTLRSSEIADQVGYNDPHYFSYVFKKNAGLSPKEFRMQTLVEKDAERENKLESIGML